MLVDRSLSQIKARVAGMMCDSDREFSALALATKYNVSHLEMTLILKGLEASEMVKRNPETNRWRYNHD